VVDLQDPKQKKVQPKAAVRELVGGTVPEQQQQTPAAEVVEVEKTLTAATLMEELAQREELQLVM
jgi:hypothetical protein